uniref:hypothetical protein n=1 Tax=uncultured Draconibacterium sp. TaxID=1573823 RepID=UPI0032177137
MKYSTYIIVGLLLILWVVVVYGFDSPPKFIHALIPLAGIIVLLRIFFKKNVKNVKKST